MPTRDAIPAGAPCWIDVFTDVRQGKRFELTVEGPVTQEALADAAKAAESVLSNPIIEDVVAIYDAEATR